jgi:D-sedoheptulose 7-phosphate isomerase
MSIFLESINDSVEIKKKLYSLEKEITLSINKIYKCLKSNNKVLTCGNGGSAADAQHLAAEYVDRLKPNINRRPFPIMSLALDTSHLTACSNDFSFNDVFSRSLEAFGRKQDVLLAISTSGNSKNILKALNKAKEIGIYSIAFLGYNGGKAKNLADTSIIVPSNNTARIQECHIFIGHYILEMVEKRLIKKND